MSLNWESTYELALALREAHPSADLAQVTLGDIHNWTVQLPGWGDDPALANDEILRAIFQEWYEVTIHD